MAVHVDETLEAETQGRRPPRRGAPRRRGSVRTWIEIALLAVFAVVMLFPVVWMLETSLKENRDVYAVPAKFLGFDLTFEHYKDVFVQRGGSGASDLAIELQELRDRRRPLDDPRDGARRPRGVGLLAVPDEGQEGPALLHPLDAVHAAGGRRDPDLPDVPGPRTSSTPSSGLILIYAAFNLSFTIWMMKGFVDEVPSEYEDAAMLDGYSRLEAFLRVTLPLLVPGIAATAVFALIFSWNEFVFCDLPDLERVGAHGAAGDRRADRRDHDRLGPRRRVGHGLRDPGAAVRVPRAQAPRRRRDARGGAALMAGIEITALHKRFPDGTVAVESLDLSIGDGELFVMLGPSGCGKTTTLRAIAGLERQTDGHIDLGDTRVDDLAPAERDIAMVFQFYALYPHLRTRDNIAFPLRAEGLPADEVERRVLEAARMLQLEPLLDRRPSRLSGGEQQRVALARALVREPQAFLMDEPLTNLDAEIRADMRTEIKHLQARLGTTMVYVTHDQLEAMSLGQRIAILNRGPARAGRDADGGLRAPGDAVLRALHRLAADQPRARRARRRRAARARRARARARPTASSAAGRSWRASGPRRSSSSRRTPARWPPASCPRRRWATR